MIGRRKRTDGKHNLLYVARDGRVGDVTLPKVGHFLLDREGRAAWGIDPRLMRRCSWDGKIRSIVTEWSCAPQHITGEAPWSMPGIKRVVREHYQDAMNRLKAMKRKDLAMQSMQIIVLVVALVIVVLVVAGLLQSGRLSL